MGGVDAHLSFPCASAHSSAERGCVLDLRWGQAVQWALGEQLCRGVRLRTDTVKCLARPCT